MSKVLRIAQACTKPLPVPFSDRGRNICPTSPNRRSRNMSGPIKVRIENKGDIAVQLRSRHWKITDGLGRVQEVKGPGRGRRDADAAAWEIFEYTSARRCRRRPVSWAAPTRWRTRRRAVRHRDSAFSPESPHRQPELGPPADEGNEHGQVAEEERRFLARHRPARPSREEAEAAVRTLIRWAGDDPDREGLVDTPDRVARAYEEFFARLRRRSGRHAGAHLRGDRRL